MVRQNPQSIADVERNISFLQRRASSLRTTQRFFDRRTRPQVLQQIESIKLEIKRLRAAKKAGQIVPISAAGLAATEVGGRRSSLTPRQEALAKKLDLQQFIALSGGGATSLVDERSLQAIGTDRNRTTQTPEVIVDEPLIKSLEAKRAEGASFSAPAAAAAGLGLAALGSTLARSSARVAAQTATSAVTAGGSKMGVFSLLGTAGRFLTGTSIGRAALGGAAFAGGSALVARAFSGGGGTRRVRRGTNIITKRGMKQIRRIKKFKKQVSKAADALGFMLKRRGGGVSVRGSKGVITARELREALQR